MDYNRHPSPTRGGRDDRRQAYDEPYQPHSRSHRPYPTESRGRDYYGSEHDPDWHRSRSRSWSPPPNSSHRSAGRNDYDGSHSHGSYSSGYRDRDAPSHRNRSRERSPGDGTSSDIRFVSRDVIIEGFGGERTDEDVGTPAVAP
ncbi:hypothetical protein EX30DRAFT_372111 [Ascodesmis nigricans]|uniref:Uncharacterized protein n=1 Tax=Ascodesmis nigricans TaxID=341454 RepID=A0A4S2MVC9_9PEZI|nr:hypothetical protein EX30DRAFT_372111 [Ascodesmis nigricans]